jgi:hypothetical protein
MCWYCESFSISDKLLAQPWRHSAQLAVIPMLIAYQYEFYPVQNLCVFIHKDLIAYRIPLNIYS